ncbi:MAG: CRISPR-associated endonuclease Cas1 [candidate division Zixibacteria bacterium]|nr:CRISPR-associated endonuclease Cas1 [candidate division Zixibacteria bacterium]
MPNLYLTEQGAVLRKTSRSLRLEKEGKQIAEVEISKLDNVLVYGNIQVTIQALRLLLENGIELSLLSESGKLYGQLTPPFSKNIFLRKRQFELFSDERSCKLLAGPLIKAKILNSIEVLRQFSWHIDGLNYDSEIGELTRMAEQAESAPHLRTLIGIEGASAKIYFGAFGKAFKDNTLFNGRSKQPPRDPANALMSFGYVLITALIQSHLEAVGFDPYQAFYHSLTYGRPSLALDILEVFRAPVADRFAVKMFNLGVFKREDFNDSNVEGFRLKPEAIKRFFLRWDECLRKMDILKIIREQVDSLRKACLGEIKTPEYYLFKAK